MDVELTEQDLSVLLESLRYSKRQVSDAQGTPYEVRQQNLARIEAVQDKLRAARDGGKSDG